MAKQSRALRDASETCGHKYRRRTILRLAGGLTVGSTGIIPLGRGQVASVQTVVVGGMDGAVYAVTGDGQESWRTELGESVESSPLVVDGSAVVGSTDGVFAGSITRLDAATGAEQWRFTTGFPVTASPTIVDETAFIGDYDGNLFAINLSDGSETWSVSLDGPIPSACTVIDETVFVCTSEGTVYALAAADGSTNWQQSFENSALYTAPTVAYGTVFVGTSDGTVVAIDVETGASQWEFEQGDVINSSPTVVSGTVFIGSNSGHVCAIDAATGSEVWSFETDDMVISSPAADEERLYIGSQDGRLYALNLLSGSKTWMFTTETAIDSSPTIAGGTVYVGSQDGRVHALDAETGTEQWQFEIESEAVNSSPTVITDTQDGHSIDSRISHGTLGHHFAWASNRPSLGTTQITGTVTSDGTPLSDITVSVHDANSDEKVTVISTDSAGEFTAAVPPGEYTVLTDPLTHESFSIDATAVALGGATISADIDKLALGAVTGEVTSHGTPIATGTVTCTTAGEVVASASIDRGTYELAVPPNTYTVEVAAPWFNTETYEVAVEEQETATHDAQLTSELGVLDDATAPPQDIDDDGVVEDVDGDGELTIFDVQTLFNNLDTNVVEKNPTAFSFTGDQHDVTIHDVQALFNRVSG
jgi:outer membrane protein assembly factor BamB